MEKQNIFLGKLHKNGCYVNDGKYGYFLTCNKKNYKIPEWFPHEAMTLEIAERYIEYKEKWLAKQKENETKEKESSDLDFEDSDDDDKDINKLLKIKK
jgi:topoisomerase IA-like protein